MAKYNLTPLRKLKNLVYSGIVISCRVRLARNLANERFPGHAAKEDLERIRSNLRGRLSGLKQLRNGSDIDIESAGEVRCQALVEKHLISTELAGREHGGAVLTSRDESIAIMLNEEDHIRIQVFRKDGDIRKAWTQADEVERDIEARAEFAYHPVYGYLTSCPTNVGTGLRASVMLHLLGLGLTSEIEQVFKALESLGFAVRGVWGEGSEAAGHLYQISNQQTLGETEEDIIDRLAEVAAETALQEQNARMRLLEDRSEIFLDCISRSLALLRNAFVLGPEEAADFLYALRMGLDAGFVENLEPEVLEYWIAASQPGHMQELANGVLDSDALDRARAQLMKTAMENVSLEEPGL